MIPLNSYSKLKALLREKKISPVEIAEAYSKRIQKFNPKINAFLEFDPEKLLKAAKASEDRHQKNNTLSEMDGIPIAIKDNLCITGELTTCSSKILENFRSPYDATAIVKLKEKGLLLIPRTNMDEFAMGSSTENSAFGTTLNPINTSKVPGGSSGGSAAAVSASFAPLALGSDTGGSIRQPASLTGIWGLKPTYGRISRYGLIAYASSLDQIGPFSNDIAGIVDSFSVMNGVDPRDQTTANAKVFQPNSVTQTSWKGKKVGVMNRKDISWQKDVILKYQRVLDLIEKEGAELVELDFSIFSYSIPIYYLIATAECSSNLSRFDGIRYGKRIDSSGKLEDLYVDSRTQGFGKEVKRRILLGTFSLSAGYYEAYYGKAQKARIMIRKAYESFFQKVDIILQPTSPSTAFELGEKTKDPLQMYLADTLTTSSNLAGVPSISCPFGVDSNGLPIGMQLTAPHFEEERLLSYAYALNQFDEATVTLPDEII